jgi:hypothetical protein
MEKPDSATGQDQRQGWGLRAWLHLSTWRKNYRNFFAEVRMGTLFVIIALFLFFAIPHIDLKSIIDTPFLLLKRIFAPLWPSRLEELFSFWPFRSASDVSVLQIQLLAFTGIVAAPFAIWRLVISHSQARSARRSAKAAQEQASVAQEQKRIAQEVATTNAFTKAVELLGATREIKAMEDETDAAGKPTGNTAAISKTVPNLEVRLGAIYALERLARAPDSSDHWVIMETLCAYIRENGSRREKEPETVKQVLALPDDQRSDDHRKTLAEWKKRDKPPVDVQAALTVIGRRRKPDQEQAEIKKHQVKGGWQSDANLAFRLDLRGAILRRAEMERLDFQYARFDDGLMERGFRALGFIDLGFRALHFINPSFKVLHFINPSFKVLCLTEPNFKVLCLTEPNFKALCLTEPNFKALYWVRLSFRVLGLSTLCFRAL